MNRTTAKNLRLTIDGAPLSIEQVCQVAQAADGVEVIPRDDLPDRMQRSVDLVRAIVDRNQSVYGVTTGFGGMAGVPISAQDAAGLQNNLLAFLAAGVGEAVDRRHVRAAMLLRANVLAQGHSGVRFDIVDRLAKFLCADATPVVRELGSIGASGDLVPLSTIGRAITGQTGFVEVEIGGQTVDGSSALSQVGLEPIELLPKEGLAIVNGTSFSAAVAANCQHETRQLLGLVLAVECMILEALRVQREPFAEFVHEMKPHPGQVAIAQVLRSLLKTDTEAVNGQPRGVQDRYSIRCLPQYLGAIVEGIARVGRVVHTEMNSVSDNPLVDVNEERFYQSGNFLGQYLGIAMDDLRRFIGLTSKHLDVQIATLVAPEFNGGLPASLRGNSDIPYNMGFKGLQITSNSIAPLLGYYGNPLVEHYPTHAEQFNQNVNGLSWGSGHLAWKCVELLRHHLAVSTLFAIQALDLRAKASFGHYDGRVLLTPTLSGVYDAACQALGVAADDRRPFLFDDSDRWLEQDVASLNTELKNSGPILKVTRSIVDSLGELDSAS